jgi:hypothetical protein
MKTLLISTALLASGLIAGSVQAADDAPEKAADKGAVSAAFGNTVMSVYPDGRSQKVWLQPNGSWEGKSRRGSALAGTWAIKADKICVKQSKPPTLPLSYCIAFPEDPHVGSSWPAKDMAGTAITLKIVKGKVTG